MKKIFQRTVIIALWLLLLSALLYMPHFLPSKAQGRSINVFAWGDILDPVWVAKFERETGISVHLNFYSSNEELIVKLKATAGKGFDLIIPSDYAVKMLIQEELLKPIKHSKLPFFKDLNPALLGHSFDPNNRFSVPFAWELYLIGINKGSFENIAYTPSWKMIFEPTSKIVMVNDPIEAVMMASFYLFGPKEALSDEESDQVKKLLIQQKRFVEAYASFRGDYFLATNNCPVMVSSSSYIFRSMRKFPFIGFVLPQEGTFVSIENLCLSAATEKEEEIYRFLSFLFRPETIAGHYETYGFFPASLAALAEMHVPQEQQSLMRIDSAAFDKLYFTRPLLSEQKMNDLWVEVK